MEQLLAKHPDLKYLLDKTYKVYRVRSKSGKTIECWERQDDGHWIDVTEREKLNEQIAEKQEELERLHRKNAKEQSNEQRVTEK